MKPATKYDSQALFDHCITKGCSLSSRDCAGLLIEGISITRDVVIESGCPILSFRNVTINDGVKVVLSDDVKVVNIHCGNMRGEMYSDYAKRLSIKGDFPILDMKLVTGGRCHTVHLEKLSISRGAISGLLPREVVEIHLTKMGAFPLETVLSDCIRKIVLRKTKLNANVRLPSLLGRLDVDCMESVEGVSIARTVVVSSCEGKPVRSPLFGTSWPS